MRAFIILVTATLLCGCATADNRYREMDWTGGVEAHRLAPDTWRISSRGNGMNAKSTIDDWALMKAADVTIASGETHFIIVSNADASSVTHGQTPGSSHGTVIGNQIHITHNPGFAYAIPKPGADIIIKTLSIKKGQPAPTGSFHAGDTFITLSSRIPR